MNKNNRTGLQNVIIGALFFVSMLFLGCQVTTNDSGTTNTISVTSVTVSGKTTVVSGSIITLSATVAPSNATSKTVTWKVISGSSYGSIGSNGEFFGKATGTVKVTATAGGVTSDAYTVTVTTNTSSGSSGGSSGGTSSGGTSSGGSTTTATTDDSVTTGATVGTSTTSSATQFIASDTSWDTLVWSDEFEGSALKTANWQYETGGGGWGNSELETYTTSTDNVQVHGNVLDITAKSDLTSGRIKSSNLRTFQYGKIVARIKCSQGTGSWPAFWMLGTGASSWPYQGEIDILEHANTDTFFYETCHWNGDGSSTSSTYNHSSWGQKTNNNYYNNISSLDITEWHTYAIEWTSTRIDFYVDDTKVMACDISETSTDGLDAFCHPFYILFNFAMGGQFTGIYNSSSFTGLPWHMYVDYVRCYQ